MTTSVIVLLAVLLATVTAALVFVVMRSQQATLSGAASRERLSAKETELASLQEVIATLREENGILQQDLQHRREENASLKTSLDHERKQFEEKLALLEDSKQQLSLAFKNMANEIFESKSKQFTETNRDTLSNVLGPLQEKIKQFEKRVEDTHLEETKQRSALEQEIKNLKDLNTRISEGAENLTQALKGDNKAQGSWGEFVLESILEKSGLVKGREYEVQVNLKTPAGAKAQPDVIVHLPESRDIIIDSKVSLKAWDSYCAADNDLEREAQLKNHVQSIRNHVKTLAAKDYQNLTGVNSLDYVFLFMPIEAAYSTALQSDGELFQFAFERNIIFVVPTTLLTTLKTVQNLWRLAQQNQNAKQIAERAGQLYDKFVNFVADLEEVGSRIDASRASFEKAHNKLVSGRGNLVRRTEQLKELGAKTSKSHSGKMLQEALEEDEDSLGGQGQDLESPNLDDSTRH